MAPCKHPECVARRQKIDREHRKCKKEDKGRGCQLNAEIGNIEQNVNTVRVDNNVQVPLASVTVFPVWLIEIWSAPEDALAIAESAQLIISTAPPSPEAIAKARVAAGDEAQLLPAISLATDQRKVSIVYRAPNVLPPGTRLTPREGDSNVFWTGPP